MAELHYWLQKRRIRLSLAIRNCVVGRVLRHISEPTLIDILRCSSCVVTDAKELIRSIPSVEVTDEEIIGLKNDFVEVKEQLRSRYERVRQLRLVYPVNWAVEEQGSFLSYCLVRALKPHTVVETGVANGHSSFVILSALKTNGRGKLVSIDIRNDVGRLVMAEERENWDIRLLSRPGAKEELRAVLQSASPVDLFIHDSEHLYGWQMTEYRAAAAVLSQGGLLISDDIDSSYAFLDFCRERGLQPTVLIDDRKALGLAYLTEEP
jgi:predicted O-methyltransferase YrrM